RQALHGVAQNSLGMMAIMHSRNPGFKTKELDSYLASRDKDGTIEARNMIDRINEILYGDVIDTLKRGFPGGKPDEWWWQGVPLATRAKCDEQMNRDNGAKERYQYLSLADYQTIVPANWQLFSERYDFGDKGNKADKVAWIGRI